MQQHVRVRALLFQIIASNFPEYSRKELLLYNVDILDLPNIVRICPEWCNFISDKFNDRRSFIFPNSNNSGLIESWNVDDDAYGHNRNDKLEHPPY